MKIGNTLFFRYVPVMVITTYFTCLFADYTRLAKLRPRSIVYLYNATDYTLHSTFGCSATDGKPIDEYAHYPQCGNRRYIESFKVNSGTLPLIAELARNKGINNGRTYIFSETIDLPGAGPISLLQQLDGKLVGSSIKVGFKASAFGIKTMWFTDENWHRVIIPTSHNDLNIHGNYVIDFCFYKKQVWSDVQSQLERSGKWADVKKSIQGFTSSAAGISLVGSSGFTAAYGTIGVGFAGGILAGQVATIGTTAAAVAGGVSTVALGAAPVVVPIGIIAALGEFVSIIPSAYDNILYKISFESSQLANESPS